MKNSSKLIFFLMMIISTLIIASSSSWLNTWIGLEINLISFISLILINKKSFSIEASIIYFIIQSLASIMFLYSIISYMIKLNTNNFLINNYINLLLISLLIKIGSAPMHFWLPLMMEGLNWTNNYLLMTWQKLGPFMLIMNSMNLKFLMIFILLSAMMGTLKGLNQTSLKKIMSFSSINQISWFLISMSMSKMMWKMYFLFYFFLLFNLIFIMKTLNLFFLNQMFNMKTFNNSILLFFFMSLFSMGGLPPFLGFFPKMMIIMSMNNYILMFTLIIFTLITLFYYIRLLYFMLFMNSMKQNLNMNFSNKNFTKLMMISNISFINNMYLLLLIFK